MLKNLRGRVAFIFEEENFDVDQIVGVKNINRRGRTGQVGNAVL